MLRHFIQRDWQRQRDEDKRDEPRDVMRLIIMLLHVVRHEWQSYNDQRAQKHPKRLQYLAKYRAERALGRSGRARVRARRRHRARSPRFRTPAARPASARAINRHRSTLFVAVVVARAPRRNDRRRI